MKCIHLPALDPKRNLTNEERSINDEEDEEDEEVTDRKVQHKKINERRQKECVH